MRKLSYRRTDRAEFIKDSSKVGSLKGTPIALRTSIKAAFHWIIHVVFEQTMCEFEPWGSKITWKVYLETCKNISEAFCENSWSNCLTAVGYFHIINVWQVPKYAHVIGTGTLQLRTFLSVIWLSHG